MEEFRLSNPVGPEFSQSKIKEFNFPESPSFDNPIVGIKSNVYGFFNFVLKDGKRSNQDT